jgi:MFS family permease
MFAVGWGANQFSPMLVVYRDELGASDETRALLFGVYAAGLIPGLLLGGSASDRHGRRRIVVPWVILSPIATLLLVLFRHEIAGLAVGRTLAGVCSGVVFGAATAWVRELSDAEAVGVAAKRAAIALTCGFAVGPLVASAIAEYAAHPLWVPYVPHLVLGTLAALLILPAPEPRITRVAGPRLHIPDVCRSPRFVRTVGIVAPWVFASASIPFAVLPTEVGGSSGGAILVAGVAGSLGLLTGVAIQPIARVLEDEHPLSAGAVGLVAIAAGFVVGILALDVSSRALLVLSAPLFGTGYGCVLISGLRETERIADPAELGATVSVFYALTYFGFVTPYLAGVLNDPLGEQGAFVALGVLALTCLVISATSPRGSATLGADETPMDGDRVDGARAGHAYTGRGEATGPARAGGRGDPEFRRGGRDAAGARDDAQRRARTG